MSLRVVFFLSLNVIFLATVGFVIYKFDQSSGDNLTLTQSAENQASTTDAVVLSVDDNTDVSDLAPEAVVNINDQKDTVGESTKAEDNHNNQNPSNPPVTGESSPSTVASIPKSTTYYTSPSINLNAPDCSDEQCMKSLRVNLSTCSAEAVNIDTGNQNWILQSSKVNDDICEVILYNRKGPAALQSKYISCPVSLSANSDVFEYVFGQMFPPHADYGSNQYYQNSGLSQTCKGNLDGLTESPPTNHELISIWKDIYADYAVLEEDSTAIATFIRKYGTQRLMSESEFNQIFQLGLFPKTITTTIITTAQPKYSISDTSATITYAADADNEVEVAFELINSRWKLDYINLATDSSGVHSF